VSIDAAQATSLLPVYERRVIDEDDTQILEAKPLAGSWTAATAGLALAPGAKLASRTVTSTSFAVGPTTWQTLDATTGVAVGSAGTYRAALTALDGALAADPTARASLRIAPSSAAKVGP
jgi:hypothetical protein